MAVSYTKPVLLEENKRHRLHLYLWQPSRKKVFKKCSIRFNIPLDKTTQIFCERENFPPLLVIRSNVNIPVDMIRYRNAPKDVDCFASEQIGSGGYSSNALAGALFRAKQVCLECHAKSTQIKNPRGGELLCPEQKGQAQTSYGNPRNPALISNLIQRYFHQPIMSNVPKQIKEKKMELEILKAAYCDNEPIEIEINGEKKHIGTAQILNSWVKEHDSPRVLNPKSICR